MERLGVIAETSDAVDRYTRTGADALSVVPSTPAGDALRELALGLAARGS